MSKLGNQSNAFFRSPQVWAAFRQVLQRHLPLHLQHTRLSSEEVWAVLSYASLRQSTLETACHELPCAPSGNRLREVLMAALPTRSVLQRQLNTALRAQLPKVFFQNKRSYALALDVTLIPYHGQPAATPEAVLRAQAKHGTHYFHGYATISIVHHRQRFVLALRLLQPHERMVDLVRDLLNRIKRLGIRVRRVYLDREFYSIQVFQTLDRRKLSYVVALPIKGRHHGLRRLCHGRASYLTWYTLRSVHAGVYRIRIALVHRYRRRQPGRWFAYAIAGVPPASAPQQVFHWYRQRFGIETGYRQMNQVRARTSSRNPILRGLLVGLALLLVNLYVTWRQGGGRARRQLQRALSLPRLAWALARQLEAQSALTQRHAELPLRYVS